eukprot:g1183.t1
MDNFAARPLLSMEEKHEEEDADDDINCDGDVPTSSDPGMHVTMQRRQSWAGHRAQNSSADHGATSRHGAAGTPTREREPSDVWSIYSSGRGHKHMLNTPLREVTGSPGHKGFRSQNQYLEVPAPLINFREFCLEDHLSVELGRQLNDEGRQGDKNPAVLDTWIGIPDIHDPGVQFDLSDPEFPSEILQQEVNLKPIRLCMLPWDSRVGSFSYGCEKHLHELNNCCLSKTEQRSKVRRIATAKLEGKIGPNDKTGFQLTISHQPKPIQLVGCSIVRPANKPMKLKILSQRGQIVAAFEPDPDGKNWMWEKVLEKLIQLVPTLSFDNLLTGLSLQGRSELDIEILEALLSDKAEMEHDLRDVWGKLEFNAYQDLNNRIKKTAQSNSDLEAAEEYPGMGDIGANSVLRRMSVAQEIDPLAFQWPMFQASVIFFLFLPVTSFVGLVRHYHFRKLGFWEKRLFHKVAFPVVFLTLLGATLGAILGNDAFLPSTIIPSKPPCIAGMYAGAGFGIGAIIAAIIHLGSAASDVSRAQADVWVLLVRIMLSLAPFNLSVPFTILVLWPILSALYIAMVMLFYVYWNSSRGFLTHIPGHFLVLESVAPGGSYLFISVVISFCMATSHSRSWLQWRAFIADHPQGLYDPALCVKLELTKRDAARGHTVEHYAATLVSAMLKAKEKFQVQQRSSLLLRFSVVIAFIIAAHPIISRAWIRLNISYRIGFHDGNYSMPYDGDWGNKSTGSYIHRPKDPNMASCIPNATDHKTACQQWEEVKENQGKKCPCKQLCGGNFPVVCCIYFERCTGVEPVLLLAAFFLNFAMLQIGLYLVSTSIELIRALLFEFKWLTKLTDEGDTRRNPYLRETNTYAEDDTQSLLSYSEHGEHSSGSSSGSAGIRGGGTTPGGGQSPNSQSGLDNGEPVQVHVGATKFISSVGTLSQSKLLASKVQDAKKPADGKPIKIFVDRDPEHFERVLNSLRPHVLMEPIYDARTRKAFQLELVYYGIDHLHRDTSSVPDSKMPIRLVNQKLEFKFKLN